MTDTLYYLCQSEDASSGIFGTAEECAAWYLTFGGAAYRLYPKDEKPDDVEDDPTAKNVGCNRGESRVWHVAFKGAQGSCYIESPFTLCGANLEEAEKALRCRIVETRLRANPDADENFYMISAEQALPVLMWVAEMREIYDLAGQPPAGSESDVKKWFWNAEHTRQGLSRMVDCLARRQRMPLSATHAAQIKAQIDALAIAADILAQHRACATHPYYSTVSTFS